MTYLIPAILVVTALVAGIFAFAPIDQAQAVHTTIQGSQLNTVTAETNCVNDVSGTPLVLTSDGDFIITFIADADGDAGTLTISDGAAAAADLVVDITDGTLITGTLAYIGGTTVTLTGDDANTEACATIISRSEDAASIAIT